MLESLIIASNNSHKIEEIKAVLADRFNLLSLEEIGYKEEIPETGSTFIENAIIKARTIYNKFNKNCFADDSGLEVHALNNEPGVYSARYAGEPVNHEKNIDKLLQNLEGVENRSARFVTVIALILDGKEYIFEGEVRGKIILERRGTEGFGYDPVFIPEHENRTFAEMSFTEKNKHSHRANALEKLSLYFKN